MLITSIFLILMPKSVNASRSVFILTLPILSCISPSLIVLGKLGYEGQPFPSLLGRNFPGVLTDAVIIFQRDEELLLFIPFVSLHDTPSRFILENEVDIILLDYREKKVINELTHETYVTLQSFLEKISSCSIEEITKVVNFAIPKRLAEIWGVLLSNKTEVKKNEWKFIVEVAIRDNAGLTQDQARLHCSARQKQDAIVQTYQVIKELLFARFHELHGATSTTTPTSERKPYRISPDL